MLKLATVIVGLIFTAASAHAEQVNPPLAPNWCESAKDYLTRSNGQAFNCSSINLRCIKMNNYGCLQQPRSAPYLGTTWGDNTKGARDHANHAIFETPEMSVVGIANVYRRYLARGIRTAEAIAETYSPWCDTLGSLTKKQDASGRIWYRTCGSSRPPVGSLKCAKPSSGAPSPGQCQACNCPSQVARQMLKGTQGISTNDELVLFTGTGAPNDLLMTIISNKMVQELGYRPSADLLRKARESYRPQDW